MVFSISNLCRPATIYFWISIIGILVSLAKFQFISVIFSAFFTLLWTALLDYLCSKGYSTVSWILLLLPIIIGIFMMINLFSVYKSQQRQEQQKQQQTPPQQ